MIPPAARNNSGLNFFWPTEGLNDFLDQHQMAFEENFSIPMSIQPINQGVHRLLDQASELTDFLQGLVVKVSRMFDDSRFALHMRGKFRRFCLVHFQKGYVQRQLSTRQGECRQCGTCCNLLLTCPMLTKEGRCLAYGTCRPQSCKVFPIDPRDIDEVKQCGGRCGFRFEG